MSSSQHQHWSLTHLPGNGQGPSHGRAVTGSPCSLLALVDPGGIWLLPAQGPIPLRVGGRVQLIVDSLQHIRLPWSTCSPCSNPIAPLFSEATPSQPPRLFQALPSSMLSSLFPSQSSALWSQTQLSYHPLPPKGGPGEGTESCLRAGTLAPTGRCPTVVRLEHITDALCSASLSVKLPWNTQGMLDGALPLSVL